MRRVDYREAMSLRVLVLAVAAATLVTACGATAPQPSSATSTSTTDQPAINMPPIGYNAADVAFVKDMIAQHQQALQISAGVPQQSSNPGVVQFAQRSSATLQADLSTLKVFLVQWTENPDVKSGGDGPATTPIGLLDSATLSRLGELTGEEFDELWLRSMLESSQGAVQMATTEIRTGQNPDTRTLARQIVGSQQAMLTGINQLLAR
jgi:uncharacterized protein (DUF305 family)